MKVLNHLTKLQADVCLLQETHLSDHKSSTVLNSPQFPHIFLANYNTRQRGVAILLSNKINFTHNSTISDPQGRFIAINISIYNNPLTIINVYGPNKDDPSFFHHLFSHLTNLPSSDLIIGGDFNTVLDPLIDRSTTANTRPWSSTSVIKQYMLDYGLGDSWRLNHPDKRKYSHFSYAHLSSSRIDFF